MYTHIPAVYKFPELQTLRNYQDYLELLQAVNSIVAQQGRNSYSSMKLLNCFIHLSKTGKPYYRSIKADGYSSMPVISDNKKHGLEIITITNTRPGNSQCKIPRGRPFNTWFVPASWGNSVIRVIKKGVHEIRLDWAMSGLGWQAGSQFAEVAYDWDGERILAEDWM